MNKWWLLALILLLGISIGFADQERKNIAVIDLESRGGLTKEEAGALTDRLRSLLVRTNAFNVVDRGKMQDILKEQGFQLSGCTSAECAVEAGKILGVEEMVSGTIGRVGKLYTLDIILIDVETSRIIKSLTRDYSGEIEGLVGLMKSIADELAGVKKETLLTGNISVKTNPPGAEVYVDTKLEGISPYTVKNLTAGEHQLKLVKEGYLPVEDRFTIQANTTVTYSTDLKKLYTIKFLSQPAAALLYINNKLAGQTPFTYQSPANSRLSVDLKKDKYKPFHKEILVKRDQTLNIKLELSDLYAKESKGGAVKKESGSSHTWLWLGGGALVAAGAAAFFLLPKGNDTSNNNNIGSGSFPAPPGRP